MFECCGVYEQLIEALAKRQRENIYGLFIVGCCVLVVRVLFLVTTAPTPTDNVTIPTMFCTGEKVVKCG